MHSSVPDDINFGRGTLAYLLRCGIEDHEEVVDFCYASDESLNYFITDPSKDMPTMDRQMKLKVDVAKSFMRRLNFIPTGSDLRTYPMWMNASAYTVSACGDSGPPFGSRGQPPRPRGPTPLSDVLAPGPSSSHGPPPGSSGPARSLPSNMCAYNYTGFVNLNFDTHVPDGDGDQDVDFDAKFN